MSEDGLLAGAVVAHDRATVDEIAAAGEDDESTTVESLLARDGVTEALALQTCNRSEAYVVTESPDTGRAALADFAPEVRDGAVRTLGHEASLEHLLRVAAGLESQVLGEDQILGQLRDAVTVARSVGGIGPVLDTATTKALHVGERARTETAINEGAVSLARAAVELAGDATDLADATALVVGAGEMATAAARALADAGVERAVVVNRTVERARDLAADLDVPATATALDALDDRVAEAEVVVTATDSREPVLDRSAFVGAGETTVVDIGLPRDVAPEAGTLDGVEVRDIDGLEAVTDRTRERRQAAAEEVERLVEEEFESLLSAFKRERADEVVAAMYEGADRIKQRQLADAVDRMEANGGLTPAQREALSDFADALVGQLLAPPTRGLRTAAEEDDWTTIRTAMELFDPTFEGDAGPVGPAGPREGLTGTGTGAGAGEEESEDRGEPARDD
ncbi:MAG: glutamyl-tRNA reductase [Haloferacaceae archaeon]